MLFYVKRKGLLTVFNFLVVGSGRAIFCKESSGFIFILSRIDLFLGGSGGAAADRLIEFVTVAAGIKRFCEEVFYFACCSASNFF